MSLTPSNMLPLGSIAPDFDLPDTVSNKKLNFNDCKGQQGTVVMFICNHCPYVIHIKEQLAKLAQDYQTKNIGFVAISANDIENYPQDAPDKMAEFAKENRFSFPYLYDESQDTAKAYMAACTPDLYLFDNSDKCVYRGRLDESSPGKNNPVDGKDLREAIDNLLSGKQISENQIPSMGCNIKWRS